MTPPPEPVFRFQNFELSLQTGELRKFGKKLKITGQPIQILTMLLENPGQIVTREAIQDRLWPGTFVDVDHSLNTAVNKIRDVLADSAETPRYIETIPRRGYRFIAPVTGRSRLDGNKAAIVAPPRKSSSIKVLILGLSLVVFLLLLGHPSKVIHSAGTITPLVTDIGRKSGLALSPDAQRVAYSWDGGMEGGGFSIYAKVIGSSEPLRLTRATAKDFSPVWSPDGRQIAFARVAKYEAGIFTVPALGGVERKVMSTRWDESAAALPRPRIAWSKDGALLAYSDVPGTGESPSIFLVRLDSLQPTRLTHPPNGSGGDFNPAFSDDGRTVAFIRDGKEVFTIGSVDTSGGSEQILSSSIMGLIAEMSWQSNRMIVSNGQLYEFSIAKKTQPLGSSAFRRRNPKSYKPQYTPDTSTDLFA